jgi:hypothetical protein
MKHTVIWTLLVVNQNLAEHHGLKWYFICGLQVPIALAWTGVQMEAHYTVVTLMGTFRFGVWVVYEKQF